MNLAADTSPEVEQRLIRILARSNASARAYATSVHPLLAKVTEKGKISGLISAGALLARKRLHYRRQGIRYSWVVVSENPHHLCELASTFAQRPDINIAGRVQRRFKPFHPGKSGLYGRTQLKTGKADSLDTPDQTSLALQLNSQPSINHKDTLNTKVSANPCPLRLKTFLP